MSSVGPLLLYLVVLAVVVTVARYFAQGQKRRLNEAWQEAARQLDGTFAPGELGWFRDDNPVVGATVQGIAVEASIRVQGSGKNKRIYTRLTAPATAPREKELRVYTEGVFSGLARAVGFQDVPVGDPDFDQAYMVKASDEAFARAWLNRVVRKRIAGVGDYRFELKRGQVVAERSGYENDPRGLVEAAQALATFADGKHHIVRHFKKVAKRLGGKAKKLRRGWASIRAEIDGIPVSVDHEELGSTHFTVVTANVVGPKLTPFALTNDRHEFSATLPKAEMADLPPGYVAWTREPRRVGASLSPAVRERLDTLQPIKIRAEAERVQIYLAGIDPPVTDMVRAAQLAAMIAVSAQATPYR